MVVVSLFLLSCTIGLLFADNAFYRSNRDHDNRRIKKELWQVMNFENEDDNGTDEDEVFGIQPTKHPFKQCLEMYQVCVQDSCKNWKKQRECFLQFYRCQNEYTARCRELYKNGACYNLLGKDECWEKLRVCYGSN